MAYDRLGLLVPQVPRTREQIRQQRIMRVLGWFVAFAALAIAIYMIRMSLPPPTN